MFLRLFEYFRVKNIGFISIITIALNHLVDVFFTPMFFGYIQTKRSEPHPTYVKRSLFNCAIISMIPEIS